MDYGTWVKDFHRYMCELRAALCAHVPDNELRLHVELGLAHYDDLFRLRAVAVTTDVFQLVSGIWLTPAERCFMWMGGYRPSELYKVHHGKNINLNG
jgi:transcription factor TGA